MMAPCNAVGPAGAEQRSRPGKSHESGDERLAVTIARHRPARNSPTGVTVVVGNDKYFELADFSTSGSCARRGHRRRMVLDPSCERRRRSSTRLGTARATRRLPSPGQGRERRLMTDTFKCRHPRDGCAHRCSRTKRNRLFTSLIRSRSPPHGQSRPRASAAPARRNAHTVILVARKRPRCRIGYDGAPAQT